MKNNRKPFKEHRFQKRAGFTDEHHLIPGSRGGQTIGSNLLKLDAYRHSAWHLLFGNKTLSEIIALLERLEYRKEYERMRYFYGDEE